MQEMPSLGTCLHYAKVYREFLTYIFFPRQLLRPPKKDLALRQWEVPTKKATLSWLAGSGQTGVAECAILCHLCAYLFTACSVSKPLAASP